MRVFPGWVHGDGGRLLAPRVTTNLSSGETGMTNAPSAAQTDSILPPSEAELTRCPDQNVPMTRGTAFLFGVSEKESMKSSIRQNGFSAEA